MTNVLGQRIRPSPEMLRAVEEATRAEDNVSLTRIFNWHFYDFFRSDPVYAMKTSHSLHRVFHRRIDELRKALRQGDERAFWEAGGRVLHYLQDMVVPAHVAPNYHVKAEGWHRIFVHNRPDAFDSLLDPRTLSFTLDNQACRRLWQEGKALFGRTHFTTNREWGIFNEMLNAQTADTRRAMLNAHLPTGESFAEAFWHLRDPEKPENGAKRGFAPYGQYTFAPGKPPCNKGSADACMDFLQRQYGQAIALTVRTLIVLDHIAHGRASALASGPDRQTPSGFSSAQW